MTMSVGVDIEKNKIFVTIGSSGGMTTTATLDVTNALMISDQLKESAKVVQKYATEDVVSD